MRSAPTVGQTGTLNGTEKVQAIQVGYSLGPVSTSIQYNKISDAVATTGPTAGSDQKYVILKAGTAF